jgi:hydrogenase maturation protease
VSIALNQTVRVLGIGNLLLGDDGIGCHAIERLNAEYLFAAGVEVIDLGTPGLHLIESLAGTQAVIVIDAISSSLPPGSVRTFREKDMAASGGMRNSPHQPALSESLATVRLLDAAPAEFLLIGVVPECLETGIGLSPSVEAALPEVLETVAAELERLGLAPRSRAASDVGMA